LTGGYFGYYHRRRVQVRVQESVVAAAVAQVFEVLVAVAQERGRVFGAIAV